MPERTFNQQKSNRFNYLKSCKYFLYYSLREKKIINESIESNTNIMITMCLQSRRKAETKQQNDYNTRRGLLKEYRLMRAY